MKLLWNLVDLKPSCLVNLQKNNRYFYKNTEQIFLALINGKKSINKTFHKL